LIGLKKRGKGKRILLVRSKRSLIRPQRESKRKLKGMRGRE
jgi:hypothetical protein